MSNVIEFNEAAESFCRSLSYENLAPRTIAFHKECLSAVSTILKRQDIDPKIKSLNPRFIKEKIINFMISNGHKVNTINGRVKTLKKFLSFLYEKGLLRVNYSNELKKVRGSTAKIESFSEEQLKILLSKPDQSTSKGLRDYTLMILLLDTGMRLSELLSIRLIDIHIKDAIIMVIPKGGREEHRVPVSITNDCVRILKKYLKQRELITTTCNSLFVSLRSEKLSARTIQDLIKNYGSDLKGVRVSAHTFRHTFARLFMMNGGDISMLQRLLRHKHIATTMIYLQFKSKDVKQKHEQYSPLGTILTRLPSDNS